MINKLQDIISEGRLTGYINGDNSYIDGKLESLRFALRKHKEQWHINMFIEHLNKFNNQYTKLDSYLKGVKEGMELNIQLMEENNVSILKINESSN